MFQPPDDPLQRTARCTEHDALPIVVYRGPVGGPHTPQVLGFDCPVFQSPDLPYRRNAHFVVTLDAGGPIAVIGAHECGGEHLPGLPVETTIGMSHVSVYDALEIAAFALGVTT